MSLEQEIGALLRQKGLTLGLVESATGGLISHRITSIPGSSEYYKGSVTAYSNEVKSKVVGVSEATIYQYGAVSPEVAEEMAAGGKKLLAADICLADTGIAGPSGATPEKPVGLFYIGLSHRERTYSQKHVFPGDREQNKQSAAEAALGWLKDYLINLKLVLCPTLTHPKEVSPLFNTPIFGVFKRGASPFRGRVGGKKTTKTGGQRG
jgi:nicotinamide-nucleotide amidase